MWSNRRRQVALAVLGGAVALFGLACAERVVYRDVRFPTPPAAAANFLGFESADDNETVCGNCHVGHQADWERTAHADAWNTLVASGHRQGFCEGCHTVNFRGNSVNDSTGGWVSTKDTRYHDVQCESCHGPGLDHVQNPEGAVPLAPIAVGADLSLGCGECHNGTHHPFVEEWEQSGHGNLLASPSKRAECQSCHTAKGALDAWGVTANYREKNTGEGHQLAIVCAVCHDPHSNEASRRADEGGTGPTRALKTPNSGGQLRYSVDVPNEEQNLCMKCHHKRAQPDIDTTFNSRGPHSPQGPLVLGENVGFWFSDTPSGDRIYGSHGPGGNPRLCATCHMARYEITDQATGAFKLQAAGHRFAATPCVDAEGNPTGETQCAITARSFRGCVGSGCHATQDAARSAFTVVTTRIDNLAAELDALIDQVRATEIRATDRRWSSAEGAQFNYDLAVLKKGSRIHNPFMIEALLTASIREMERTYGLSAQVNVDLRNIIGTPHLKVPGNE